MSSRAIGTVLATLFFLSVVSARVAGNASKQIEQPRVRPDAVEPPPTEPTLAPAVTDSIILGNFTFDDSLGGPDPQGWVTVDRTAEQDTFFHIDDFQGLGPAYQPIQGNRSLWCGARPDSVFCYYATLPGYGDAWLQDFESVAFSVTGDATVSFVTTYDMEPGYDFATVQVWDGIQWSTLLTMTGQAQTSKSIVIPSATHGGSLKIRFRFESSIDWSDEDGLWPTDGAIIIDSLAIVDSLGTVDFQDFESDPVGDTSTADMNWQAKSGGIIAGNHAALFDGSGVLQEDSLVQNNTHVWGFFNNSPDIYFCFLVSQAAVPIQSSPLGGPFMWNEIWSPLIDLNQDINGTPVDLTAASDSLALFFDVYRDLPLNLTVFYDFAWRFIGPGCQRGWVTDNFVYYGDAKDWWRHSATFAIDPSATHVQIALAVRDLCPVWCDALGVPGICHSHAPLFDNVVVLGLKDKDIVVTNTNDSGSGSFRQAMLDANADPDKNGIVFNIPGAGSHVIAPGLPPIPGFTSPVVIDGYTQPGASPNTNGPGLPGNEVILVEYSGANLTLGGTLNFSGGNSTLRGLAIHTLVGSGVALVSDNNIVEGNHIGTSAGGNRDVGNGFSGVVVSGSNNRIGGIAPGSGNLIRFNDRDGVTLGISAGPGNTILGNRIDSNDLLGIDLNADGVTANDVGDGDAGPNNLQNYPIVNFATVHADSIVINGTAHGVPNDSLIVEFFSNTSCDPSSNGEGEIFLGRVTGVPLDGSGTSTGSLALPVSVASGAFITATATGSDGSTSEFSPCVEAFNTPVGSGVVAQPPDSLKMYPVTLTFDSILVAGTTSLEYQSSGPPVEGSYSISGSAVFYNLTTTAVYADSIEVCFNYNEGEVLSPESDLRLIHYDTTLMGWVNITTSLDTVANIICGRTLTLSPFVAALYSGPTGILPDSPLPSRFALYQNVPNPFNPSTIIRYDVPAAGGLVTLRIYDVRGRLLRTLINGPVTAGVKKAAWNGLDDRGQRVASGIYFYRLQTPGFVQTRKMLLLK